MFAPEQQPASFGDFIEKVNATRALSVIELMIEEYRILFDEDPQQQAIIEQLLGASDDLDQIQLICAQYLGHHDRVRELTEWISGRPQRRQFAQEHRRTLGEAMFGDILK